MIFDETRSISIVKGMDQGAVSSSDGRRGRRYRSKAEAAKEAWKPTKGGGKEQ